MAILKYLVNENLQDNGYDNEGLTINQYYIHNSKILRKTNEKRQNRNGKIFERISYTTGNVVRIINEFNNIPNNTLGGQTENNYLEAKMVIENSTKLYNKIVGKYIKLLEITNESINNLVHNCKTIEMTQVRKFINLCKKVNKQSINDDKKFFEIDIYKDTYVYSIATNKLLINSRQNKLIQSILSEMGDYTLENRSEKAIVEARQFKDSIDNIINEIYEKQVLLKEIYYTFEEVNDVLTELSLRFDRVLNNIIYAFNDKGEEIDYDTLTLNDKKLLEKAISFVTIINKIINTKVITEVGDINPDCKDLIKDAENFLSSTVRVNS